MKRILLSLVAFAMGFSLYAQTHLYENPNFDQITKDHKLIAILPFKATVKLRPKEMKNMTQEQLAEMAKNEGENIQSGMYSWFLKRQKNGDMWVKVQDINTTGAILSKNEINIENLDKYTPKELAQLLEVDAVIMGTFDTNKPMSEGASIALGLLVGFYGATNNAVLNLFIYNGSDGELLINYNKAVSGSLGSSTENLINTLMRKASRRISYSKKD